MNKIIEKSKEINELLKSNSTIKEFLEVKELLMSDQKLQEIKEKSEVWKKNFCISRDKKDKREHLKYENMYNDSILKKRYDILKIDVYEILNQLSSILS